MRIKKKFRIPNSDNVCHLTGSPTTIIHSQPFQFIYIKYVYLEHTILRPSTIKTTHSAQCNFSAAIDYLYVRFLWMILCLSVIAVSVLFFLVPILQCNSNCATIKNASGKNDYACSGRTKKKERKKIKFADWKRFVITAVMILM